MLYLEGRKEGEVTQSYPTLWDPMDCSLSGSSIHGILQAKIPIVKQMTGRNRAAQLAIVKQMSRH